MVKWKRFLVRLLHWTWGFPQTLAGFVYSLYLRVRGYRAEHIDGVVAIQHTSSLGYISLGGYLTYDCDYVFKHEYGHSLQSLMLGPFYLLVVGLPSALWALYCSRSWSKGKHVDYYSFYTEKWANKLAKI